MSLISYIMAGRLVCAQTVLFSYKPVSKNVRTIYFKFGERVGGQLAHPFGEFFHQIIQQEERFVYKLPLENYRG